MDKKEKKKLFAKVLIPCFGKWNCCISETNPMYPIIKTKYPNPNNFFPIEDLEKICPVARECEREFYSYLEH